MIKRFSIPQVKTTNSTNRPKRSPRPMADMDGMMDPKRPYMMYEVGNAPDRELFIYISDQFDEPLLYAEMIHLIRTASAVDTIYIHLNTPGGRLDTGVQIISAIRATEARVVTVLDGVAHSMGALLFLCGHELVVHEHSQLMFHTYSGGVFGKGSDIVGQTEATEQWFRAIATDVCYPFMTRNEIKRMLRGEDFWFQFDQIDARIKKMTEILQAQADAEAIIQREQQVKDLVAALNEFGFNVELSLPDDEPEEEVQAGIVTHYDEDEPGDLVDLSVPELVDLAKPKATKK